MSKLKHVIIGTNIVIWATVAVVGIKNFHERKQKSSSVLEKSYGLKIGKMQRSLDVKLEWVSLSESVGGPSVIRASIKPLVPFQSDLEYQWILPQGAVLISGSDYGAVGGDTSEKSFLIEITGVSSEEFSTIVLQAGGELNGGNIGGAGALATRKQNIYKVATESNPSEN